MSERAAALVVAAGAGKRFGGALPKVFVPVAGAPLCVWALRAYDAHPAIERLCLVVAPEFLELATRLRDSGGIRKPCAIVGGGAERRQSVRNGLLALRAFAPDLVAIHDGARPLVTAEMITDGLRVADEGGAAVAAYPASDTVKQVADAALIAATLDRRAIYLAQTPQTFRFDLILDAHERAEAEGWEVTDDGVLLERLGHPVRVSLGHPSNLKVTRPEDQALAEWLLAGTKGGGMRIGHGFDLHRLVEGRALVLGGVTIPYERGLLGHSDADAALHALADAILGAGALGDIGQHFPDNDPAYAGADSRELLKRVVALAAEAGWQVGNADVTILAQAPKLAPHVMAMRQATAEALGVPLAAVSYKATTMEKLGPIGEGQAIAAEAVVCLKPR